VVFPDGSIERMPRTPVTLRENAEKHYIEAVTEDGEVAGWVDFVRKPDGTFVAVHTEVDPDFEGQGIGGQIAAGVVEMVRGSGQQLRPDCPFIADWLRRHPDAQDVVVEGLTF
jgi:predicted GNAT family acetyltransferase